MRKLISWLLAAVLALGLMLPAWAAPDDVILDISTERGATPPVLEPGDWSRDADQAILIQAGKELRFAVCRDNFRWQSGASGGVGVPNGEGVVFDRAMLCDYDVWAQGDALPFFGEPRLVVEGGAPYIICTARTPTMGQKLTLSVALCKPPQNVSESEKVSRAVATLNVLIDVASGGQDGGSETDGGQGGGSGTSGGEGGDGGESRPESVEGLWVAGLAPGTLTDAAQAALGAFPMASAGESLWIPLTASSFLWNGGDENAVHPRDDAPVRLSQLTQATVDVAWSEHSEVSVVKWVGLGERAGRAGIRVELAAVILSLDEVSFSLDLWLTHAGQSGEKTGIAGAVRAEVLEPDAGTGWLDISGGQAVWPASDIAGIALYLGEGVTLRISLRQGEGYCGVAVCDSAPDPQQMPGLLRVYSLYVLGLSQADSVLIESAPDSGVYDAGGNYLGAASSPLPFRDRYFLCDRKEQGSITTIGSSGISSGGGASSSSRGREPGAG